MTVRVIAVDVGSVNGNYAWAGLDLPGRRPVGEGGRDPEGTARGALEALADGVQVALGFEAPLMVPVSPAGLDDGWRSLGRSRHGETVDGQSRPWSAGAGSGALATGLVQLAWVLERIALVLPGLRCTTRPEPWLAGEADLLVWEAFVSGTGKPVASDVVQHAADAMAAAATFADRLEQSTLIHSDVVCAPASSFNLAAAAASYAGLAIAGDELRVPVQVYRTPGGLPRTTAGLRGPHHRPG